tara:strand:- start:3689 stop:3823 length:135 start_codon:yes stop_codon:yes gene_type:complete
MVVPVHGVITLVVGKLPAVKTNTVDGVERVAPAKKLLKNTVLLK